MTQSSGIPTTALSDNLRIRRMATGLWQVAGGHGTIEFDAAVDAVQRFYQAGFTTFDMADHYGPAEEIVGAFLERSRNESDPAETQVFTKWVPEPGELDEKTVRAAVDRARTRLKSDRIDLLQFHWWDYLHPGYLTTMESLTRLKEEGLIGEIGLTNFDTAHMRILLRMGIPVVSNQIHFSLLTTARPMTWPNSVRRPVPNCSATERWRAAISRTSGSAPLNPPPTR